MPSLIPGFEYDIFISYRQKDNKHDGWVTEFVDQLRGELESTFKEEISVYFDINPHDGLLETHDVDESLKEKLKCLIFIPIISRTYCDPKSFAWEHEFKAFVEQASKDRFGLKIKLPNGNVASRVLPVQIHDLKPDDKALVENVLGGFLRSIEFIYKEPGVNRSLTDKDSENKNLNKTNYRNQINKVANAIDEIITALEQPLQKPGDIQKEVIKPVSVQQKRKKFVLITASVILAVLVVIGIFFLPKLTKASEKVEKSIAVLPFINDSPSDSNKYFIDGIMVDILNNLQTVKDLRVISRTSAEKYRNTSKSIPEIAKELGVNYIVEGSGQKSGNTIRLSVQLLTVAKESHLWGDSYEKELHEAKDIFDIQSQIAKSITSELKAIVTPHEKQLIDKIPTKNLDAYEAVLKGNFYLNKFTKNDLDTAFKYFELAKEKDPDYAPAYFGISGVWGYRQQAGFVAPAEARPKGMEALMKAVEIDSTFSSAGFSGYYCWNLWDWEKAEKEFKKGIDNNPNDAGFRRGYSHLLIILGRNDEALKQIEVAVKLDPLSAFTITWYGIVLTFAHRYDEAIKAFQDALKMEPIYPFASGNLGITLELSGKKIEALEQYKLGSGSDTEAVNAYKKGYIEGGFRGAQLSYAKLVEMRFKKSYWNPTDIAITYVVAGEKDKALYWLEQGFKVHDPNMPYLLHPIYDSLRDDPRFQDLCKRMKLPYK